MKRHFEKNLIILQGWAFQVKQKKEKRKTATEKEIRQDSWWPPVNRIPKWTKQSQYYNRHIQE